jgi:aspartate-semialdehyde dehydrogenase
MKKILIIGAHSAVAKSLLECLEERDVEVELVRATTSEHLQPGLVLIDEAALRSADLVVLAVEDERLAKLALSGKMVLDLTETLRDEDNARWIFPGIEPAALDPARPSIIPVGLAVPVISVLRALADLSISRASLVTLESAAIKGQPGIDELSEQVRARFNMRDVEAKVFPSVLAFGGLPLEDEEALREAIEAGVPELELLIMRTIVPTFSADSAVLVLDLADAEATPDPDEVKKKLAAAKGMHLFDDDEAPSSFDAIGRDDALVGRVTAEAGRVGLWIACDRLRRGSATLAALAIEQWVS